MKLLKKAQAGSFESSDILILIEPNEKGEGRKIDIESGVFQQYGDKIKKLIVEMLDTYKIKDIRLKAHDKGAIDAVILARMETVLTRGLDQQQGTLY